MLKQELNLLNRMDNNIEFINNMGKMSCYICNNIMIDPVKMLPIGHDACRSCTAGLQYAPGTKQPFHIGEVDPEVKEKLGMIQIRCRNKSNGCNDTFNIPELHGHEKLCPFRKLKCINDKCETEVIAKEMPSHQKNCQFSIKQCAHCQKPLIFKDLSNHEATCREKMKECPGCKLQVKTYQYEEHSKICEKIEIDCQKCMKKMKKEEIARHDEISCLEGMIEDFKQTASHNIEALRNSIAFLTKKLKEKENFLHIKCHKCNQYQCEIQTRFCDSCNRSYCTKCFKMIARSCPGCMSNNCNKCLRAASKEGGCIVCAYRKNKSSAIIPEATPPVKKHVTAIQD